MTRATLQSTMQLHTYGVLRSRMLACFQAFGGVVHGVSKPTGKPMRFKAAINARGDLCVSIYLGNSTKVYHSLPLDEWAEWASEHVAFSE